MDSYKKYVDRQTYKSLAVSDFFNQQELNESQMRQQLKQVFERCSDYKSVCIELKLLLNDKGLKKFRTRYKTFKSNLSSNKSFKIDISQENGERLSKLRQNYGGPSKTDIPYDMIITELLDRKEDVLRDYLKDIQQAPDLTDVLAALSYQDRKRMLNQIMNLMTEAFVSGVNSVALDHRKKKAQQTSFEQNIKQWQQDMHNKLSNKYLSKP